MKNINDPRRQAYLRLLMHAARHSPYYRSQQWARHLLSGRKVRLQDIPVTPKSTVRDHTALFYSDEVPSSEGPTVDKWTTGSTGEPILIKKTARQFEINAAENIRLKAGWGFAQQTGYVKRSEPDSEHGEGTVTSLRSLGMRNGWKIYTVDPRRVIDLLVRSKSSQLAVYPSAGISILELRPRLPHLRLISTAGEVVTDELKALIQLYPQCAHFDIYGSTETGVIAAKCSRCGNHHFASLHLLVETLDGDGNAVPEGELGRVVVTPLHNLAMPLLRYELGDCVRVSSAIDCPVSRVGITQIAGREKHLFILPDGTRIVPAVSVEDVTRCQFLKYKLLQVSRSDVRLLYVPRHADVTLSDEAAQDIVNRNVSPLFRATAVRVDEIRPARGGKYFQHECLL